MQRPADDPRIDRRLWQDGGATPSDQRRGRARRLARRGALSARPRPCSVPVPPAPPGVASGRVPARPPFRPAGRGRRGSGGPRRACRFPSGRRRGSPTVANAAAVLAASVIRTTVTPSRHPVILISSIVSYYQRTVCTSLWGSTPKPPVFLTRSLRALQTTKRWAQAPGYDAARVFCGGRAASR